MPTLFPSTALQTLSALLYILGLTALSHCLSRRSADAFTSWTSIKRIPWTRMCVLLVFIDSWLFLASSNVFIFGVGLEASSGICLSAILICIGFYSTSKLLSYLFLIEKVYVVWSPVSGRRRKSLVYMISMVTVGLYAVIIALLIFGRIAFFRPGDQACTIGLKGWSAYPLLAYDVYINLFLTALFVWPILRSKLGSERVRSVATRTLLAALVSLTTSTFNIALLASMKGHQLGWVCLGFCGLDVIVNALALFWVTSGSAPERGPSSTHEGTKMTPITLTPTPLHTPLTSPTKPAFGMASSGKPNMALDSSNNPKFGQAFALNPPPQTHKGSPKSASGLFHSNSMQNREVQIKITTDCQVDVSSDEDTRSRKSQPPSP